MMNIQITKHHPNIGARVVCPDGRLGFVERRAKDKTGKPHIWVLDDRYPLEDCSLPEEDRLSDWYGCCRKCHQPASDYAPRQKVGKTWEGGFAFCEPCLTTWKLPVQAG